MNHGPLIESSRATQSSPRARQRGELRAGGAMLAALLAGGCVGSVGDTDPKTPPGVNPPGMQPGMMQPGDMPKPPGDMVPPPTIAAPGSCGAPVYSTLITKEQYINTVGDLLGIDVRTAVTFTDASGRKFSPELRRSTLEAEGFMSTARTIADQAVAPAALAKLVPCDPAAGDQKCAHQFIDRFGARATRRPLSTEARTDLQALYAAGQAEGGFAVGIKWVVEGLLKSPDFLYHLVTPSQAKPGDVVNLDDFEIADRLAFFLWNSGPDEALWTAAEGGKLHQPTELAAQVTRMRTDARAARTRVDFYRNLLSLDLVGSLTRDDPSYTPDLAKALEKSMLAGIHSVYQGDGKSDTLLGSSTVFVDGLMAKLYGAPAGGTYTADVKATEFDRNQRRGLLTHPALMATIAEHDTSDPIHRGTFVYTKMLCRAIPPPADAVPALPTLSPNLTTRQRLAEHRAAPICAGCHQVFDPIGLAFENFDQLGRFRSDEHGMKVDSSGEIIEKDIDIAGPFPDGFTLFDRLAKSRNVRDCMAQQWYEYASRRDVAKADSCSLDGITKRFRESGDLNDLLTSIALSDTFRNRLVAQE